MTHHARLTEERIMASGRRAFTLVELLVVVGIIAALVAVLLPALGRAREQANRVKCGANLHSLGHAMALYTQSYGHYPGAYAFVRMPAGMPAGWTPGYAVWPARLRALLGGSQVVFHCPSREASVAWEAGADGSVLNGADADLAAQYGYQRGEAVVSMSRRFSYGYNAWGEGSHFGSRVERQLGLGG